MDRLITFGVTTFGPVQMTERQLLRHIVQNPSGMHDLLFAAVPPLVAAIAVGITLTLWRLRYPFRRYPPYPRRAKNPDHNRGSLFLYVPDVSYEKTLFCYNEPMPKDLFKGTARYYARYRPGYPDAFFKYVAKAFGLNGMGHFLGPRADRPTAIPLAHYFKKVVAMDPEAAMLKEGKQAGKKAKVNNIKWTKGSSDNLKVSTGPFRLVVMGRSSSTG